MPSTSTLKLSIVIPVYNERTTLPIILVKVLQSLPEVGKEIVIVDDGSVDGTREWLSSTLLVSSDQSTVITCDEDDRLLVLSQIDPEKPLIQPKSAEVKVLLHHQNQGKGAALRTGLQATTGDVVVIQDADLEYDPQDWSRMWRLIQEGWADIVYGSRFYGEPHRVLYFHHMLGNKLITTLINLFCDTTLSDIEVCYKMFRREVLEGLKLKCNDFGFEVEFTMKLAKARRWRWYEVGICYYGRTYAEGKKINWKDGVKALWYIFKFQLSQ